jgi:YtcA family
MIKNVKKQLLWRAPALGLSLVCASCGRAPSVEVIGSFFPVWMVCLTIAVILTFGVRYLLLRYKIEQEVGPLALFYPSSVVLLTSLLWLIFYR